MSITGSNNQFSCSPAINVATNTIIALGTVTRSGNAFTFSVGFVWKINGTIYQNNAPVTITVAEAATGFYRIDNAILNTSNSIELQQGLASDSVALQPVVPETAVLLTSWNISGPSVSDQTEPTVGATFVKKSFADYLISNVSGEETSIALDASGKTEIRLTNDQLESIASVDILSFSSATNPELPYPGKAYLIRNLTGNPITIIHDAALPPPNGQRPRIFAFSLKEATDLVVPNNEAVLFHWTNGFMVEIFRSWSEVDLSQKADLVAGKVPADQLPSYVDDVLEFTNLAALPTTGEASKIYVTLDTNKQYRWGGTAYVEIGTSNPFGVHILTKTISGNFYGNMIGLTTDNNISLVASNVYLFPFMPKNTLSIDNMYVNVATAGTSAIGKIAIYSELNGVPNSKLAETGDIAFSTVGVKTIPINFIFIEGVTYWLAYLSNVNCVLRALGSSSCPVISASDPLVSFNQAQFGYFQNSTSGFPNNINSSLLVRTSSGSVKTIFKAL